MQNEERAAILGKGSNMRFAHDRCFHCDVCKKAWFSDDDKVSVCMYVCMCVCVCVCVCMNTRCYVVIVVVCFLFCFVLFCFVYFDSLNNSSPPHIKTIDVQQVGDKFVCMSHAASKSEVDHS